MSRWRPQHFRIAATKAGGDPSVIENALAIAKEIKKISPGLTPVFTLRHLAFLTDVRYSLIRSFVTRRIDAPYRVFRISKKSTHPKERRFRTIAVPTPPLLHVQRWITQSIVAHAEPHAASRAYSKKCKILEAAEAHCGSRWLIKLDIKNFFESINEIAVYRVFLSLGYQPLVAFELARICTRIRPVSQVRDSDRKWAGADRWAIIREYAHERLGHLPQGAPSSPMLANLAVRDLDKELTKIAEDSRLIYTRYADDLTFSTHDIGFGRDQCRELIGTVYAAIGSFGLSPNTAKTRVSSPGARKIVVGLLVDGQEPRLSREFRARMRQHLYYMKHTDIGPAAHAHARGFASLIGFRNHLYGLVSFARQVDPAYADSLHSELSTVNWPL